MSDLSSFLAWYGPLVAAHVGITLFATGLGTAIERSPLGRTRQIQSDPVPPGQLRREVVSNLMFCALAPAGVAALLASEVVGWGSDAPLRVVATFAACSVAFDIYFYGLHRALHTRRLMPLHRHHHLSRVTGPLTGQSMSLGEACGWLLGYCGVPLALGLFAPLSLVGYLAYLSYNVFGNVIAHANVEMAPPALTRSPAVWLAHPYTFHALHHARFVRHFGFGSTFMDRLAGTEWPDWVDAYASVMRGRPLRDHGKVPPPQQ